MLTVITNTPVISHERSGVGVNNNPELRQELILEKINEIPDVDILYIDDMISFEWLCNIHDYDYLSFLSKAYTNLFLFDDRDWIDPSGGLVPNHFTKTKPKNFIPIYKMSGYYASDVMSPIYEDTYKNCMIAANQACKGAEILCSSYNPRNIIYALTPSPGHHAKYEEYSGYCFINNACVAAYRMLELGIEKIAILDIDFHAGNGSAHFAANHPAFKHKLIACSIHADPKYEYPSFEGYEDDYDDDYIKNIVLERNTTWIQYKRALDTVCEFIDMHKINTLIIAFGADTYKDDPDANPLARMRLELEDYDMMGKLIRQYFPDVPILVTQEGGYDLDNVPEIVCRFLHGLKI
jgi:acetoin utilization deacetylase AcuC-like enzyme